MGLLGWFAIILHTSKRMHFIEDRSRPNGTWPYRPCIRQNVCTSLRSGGHVGLHARVLLLHTSKRMHFIEDPAPVSSTRGVPSLHTSKRMHFIEDVRRWWRGALSATCIRQNVCTSLRNVQSALITGLRGLAYVKTYALH